MVLSIGAAANQNIVDRNVDDLDEEADEAHDQETDASRPGDLFVLCERTKKRKKKSI